MPAPHTLRSLKRDVEVFIQALATARILLASNTPIIRADGDEWVLTWARAPKTGFRARLGQLATVDEYRSALDHGLFTVILINGDILQFHYRYSSAGSLLGQSLAFLPCPLDLPYETRDEDESFGDFFDAHYWASDEDAPYGPPNLRLRGPCRFDFDATKDEPLHTAAHLHISYDDCRVPVQGPLSIGEFVSFIFCSFETEWWSRFEPVRKTPKRDLGKSLEACADIHLVSP